MESTYCRTVATANWRPGIVAALIAALTVADAGAADGYFDGAWPKGVGGGRITLTPGQASNVGNDIAFRADGSMIIALATSDTEIDFSGGILVAGYAQLANGPENYSPFVVVRLLPDDGSIDTTLGIGGKSFGLFNPSDVAASAFRPALARGARLMLVGTSTPPANSLTPSVGLGRLYTDLVFWGGFEPPTNDSN